MSDGIMVAVGRLELLRDELGADELAARFTTRHGRVEVICSRFDPLRVLVNGEEVPRGEP